MQGQVDDAIKKLEDKLVPKGPGVTRYTELPKEGFSDDRIREILTGCVAFCRVCCICLLFPPLYFRPPPLYPHPSIFNSFIVLSLLTGYAD